MDKFNELEEPNTVEAYEPPALVEVGEFSQDTLGFGHRFIDVLGDRI
ncbi:lasso RiPP family leader peptide-containing protein [Streptomyces boninensis]